jgi:hypothetical protein
MFDKEIEDSFKYKVLEHNSIDYLGSKIMGEKIERVDKSKAFICWIWFDGNPKNFKDLNFLNVGECHNGDQFTSIGQAINQAKDIVNFKVKL